MVYYVFFDNKALGGSDGLYINFKPSDAAVWASESAMVSCVFHLGDSKCRNQTFKAFLIYP